jgi:NAD-dependent deacetylase
VREAGVVSTASAELADRLARARRVTVLTGAGVSAASGVPTFRGPEGFWKDFRPEDLATPEAFARDPATVWEWYDWRRQRIAKCRPNPAHEVLALWSRRYPLFTLVTQNVDGLHEAAGTSNVLRFHGSIWEVLCSRGCKAGPRREDRTSPFPILPPPCACGAPLRPGVVWFGEAIDSGILQASAAAIDCDVCIAVGTSAVVYPAAGLLPAARERGAFTAEINPEATPATSGVDCAIPARAEEALPEVERRLLARGG